MTQKSLIKPLAWVVVAVTALTAGTAPAFASSDADTRDTVVMDLDRGGAVQVGVDPLEGISFLTDSGERGATVMLPGATALSDAFVGEAGTVAFRG